jgi:hypothetical protein
LSILFSQIVSFLNGLGRFRFATQNKDMQWTRSTLRAPKPESKSRFFKTEDKMHHFHAIAARLRLRLMLTVRAVAQPQRI